MLRILKRVVLPILLFVPVMVGVLLVFVTFPASSPSGTGVLFEPLYMECLLNK